ncbi:energy-coupling factor ABC transporter substrate-binding protein [Paenibacillus hexagrammi]|uniref:Cobalt transport protein CbiN n=1 Tax=Paenibacillus hexagrammi TaxID=2908839 RepID=A0ABY3SKG2_9BACL|nr:energy-coupling factor ABC transporter substrate-binding protein [Paenibacillus sp. YPD9-1]UJF34451.1 energy-coupling factor ABC transporter substrate-binding protein [Paenibacillus sp. YPD9-1]
MKIRTHSFILIAIIVLLAVLPLIFVSGDFGGADDAAEGLIQTLAPSYVPWFSSLFELPSETESLLFALQAAIGAGFIGYAIGVFKGRASRDKDV